MTDTRTNPKTDIQCRYHHQCGDIYRGHHCHIGMATGVAGVAGVRMDFLVQTYTIPAKVIPMASYILFSSALGLLIGHLYLNANGHVNPALVAQILLTAALVGTLGLAHFLMYYHTFQLQQEGLVVDKWLTRYLVHSELALFISWEVIELMVSVNVAMQYNSGKTAEPDVASSFVLVSYIVVVTIWLILETSVLDQFIRYTQSIYPMFIWYFATALIDSGITIQRNKHETTAF